MKVYEFLLDENNKEKYGNMLKGCGYSEVYHYNNLDEYIEMLRDNEYEGEELEQQIEYIKREMIQSKGEDDEFIELV